MGLLDFLKKRKKLSPKSVNFARLVKNLCMTSGISIPTQLKITKNIAHDFIDNKNHDISKFVFMEHNSAKQYLIQNGMNELDAEIFLNIIQSNRDTFLAI